MSGFHYPGVPVTALLYSLWPLFALIVGGYALRRWDFPGTPARLTSAPARR